MGEAIDMSYFWNDGSDYLVHHGIKGQKWGVRNYQNPDGTLTSAGKERYRSESSSHRPHSRQKTAPKWWQRPASDVYVNHKTLTMPGTDQKIPYGTTLEYYHLGLGPDTSVNPEGNEPAGGHAPVVNHTPNHSGYGYEYGYGATSDTIVTARRYLDDLNQQYGILNTMIDDQVIENADEMFNPQMAARLKLGDVTVDDVRKYMQRVAYDLGKNLKEHSSNASAFDKSMKESIENEKRRFTVRANTRSNVRQGRTSRGYAKIEEK